MGVPNLSEYYGLDKTATGLRMRNFVLGIYPENRLFFSERGLTGSEEEAVNNLASRCQGRGCIKKIEIHRWIVV